MKKISVLFLFMIIFYAGFSFSKNNCKSCNYENDDNDRYCLNCSTELRTITPEEKAKLDEINTLQAKRAEEERNKIIENELRKKAIDKKKETFVIENTPSGKTSSLKVLVNGIAAARGMTKPDLRRRFNYSSSSYPYAGDVWKIVSRMQTTFFYFSGAILTRYETTINYDYFIRRDFPLDIKDIKNGMAEEEIKSLWGDPDIKYEENSESSFVHRLVYYINEPSTDLLWKNRSYSDETASFTTQLSNAGTKLENCLLKSGKTAELLFDENGILVSFSEKEGKKRELIERPLGNPII